MSDLFPSSNVSTTSLSGMGAPSNLSAAAAQGNPIIKVAKNTVMSFVILISFFIVISFAVRGFC